MLQLQPVLAIQQIHHDHQPLLISSLTSRILLLHCHPDVVVDKNSDLVYFNGG